ncbi:unnamed protein product [Spirodela intermedia]|uniref:Uncharacterized protein n=2 Tax=Spirodela intermedia TaxID=51605 RepID=A0A7I8K2C3_SPIIN|nr:unnamed protein product [Spirodela intermedia]CAA6655317.1 unnamed protein product [Spirodela intermedia]CAA7390554.1 unnamed protein product [Spirodela intermedia]
MQRCFQPSQDHGKVFCCDFSSEGNFLASGGDDKVLVWDTVRARSQSSVDDHSHTITDIRFRPESVHLATSSFDRTVETGPSSCLTSFTGHKHPVTSVDFHPSIRDLICSCDNEGETRLWSAGNGSCVRVSEGATARVRFHPGGGQLLATASEASVFLFDVETSKQISTLKSITCNPVERLSWDAAEEYVASTCQDAVRVWSVASGACPFFSLINLRGEQLPLALALALARDGKLQHGIRVNYVCLFHPQC